MAQQSLTNDINQLYYRFTGTEQYWYNNNSTTNYITYYNKQFYRNLTIPPFMIIAPMTLENDIHVPVNGNMAGLSIYTLDNSIITTGNNYVYGIYTLQASTSRTLGNTISYTVISVASTTNIRFGRNNSMVTVSLNNITTISATYDYPNYLSAITSTSSSSSYETHNGDHEAGSWTRSSWNTYTYSTININYTINSLTIKLQPGTLSYPNSATFSYINTIQSKKTNNLKVYTIYTKTSSTRNVTLTSGKCSLESFTLNLYSMYSTVHTSYSMYTNTLYTATGAANWTSAPYNGTISTTSTYNASRYGKTITFSKTYEAGTSVQQSQTF